MRCEYVRITVQPKPTAEARVPIGGAEEWDTKYIRIERRYAICSSNPPCQADPMTTDPPRGQEEWIPIDPRFQHGIDLVKFIRSEPEFASDFCIGVAGQWLAQSMPHP